MYDGEMLVKWTNKFVYLKYIFYARISDQGTHFVNVIIKMLLQKFIIENRHKITYHQQVNVVVESLNKTLHKGPIKNYGIDKDD